MADKINISEKELRNIVYEEIRNLEEGFLDRFLARSKGTGSQLKQVARNIGAIGKAVSTGEVDQDKLKDPRVVRQLKMASSRINGFSKEVDKITIDFMSDLEAFFGEGLENAPDSIKGPLERFSKSIELTKAYAQRLAKNMESGRLSIPGGRFPAGASEKSPAGVSEDDDAGFQQLKKSAGIREEKDVR
mgnify:CR=1 FL=1